MTDERGLLTNEEISRRLLESIFHKDGSGALDQIRMVAIDNRRILVNNPAGFEKGPARIYDGRCLMTLTILGWEPIPGKKGEYWVHVAPELPDFVKSGHYLVQSQKR